MNLTFDWNNPTSLACGAAAAAFLVSWIWDWLFWRRRYGQSGLGTKMQALRERAGSANALQDRLAVLEQEKAKLQARMEQVASGDSGAIVQEFKNRAEAAERELETARRELSAAGSGANSQVDALRQRAETAESSLSDAHAKIARYGEMAAELALTKNQLVEKSKELASLRSASASEGSGPDNEKLRTRAEEAERYVQVLKLEMSQMAPQTELKYWQEKVAEAEAAMDELRSHSGDSELVESLRTRNNQAELEIERLRFELAQITDATDLDHTDLAQQLTREKSELEEKLVSTRKEAERVLSEMQSKLDEALAKADAEQVSSQLEALTRELEDARFENAKLNQSMASFGELKAQYEEAQSKISELTAAAESTPEFSSEDWDDLQSKVASLTSQLGDAKATIEELRASAVPAGDHSDNGRISALEKERTALMAKLDATKQAHDAEAAVAQAAQARIDVAENELTEFLAKFKELEETAKKVAEEDRAAIQEAEERFKAASHEATEFKAKLAELEAHLNELTEEQGSQLQTAETRARLAEKEVASLEHQLEELGQEHKRNLEEERSLVRAAEAKVDLAEKEIEDLKRKLTEGNAAAEAQVAMATESLQKENLAIKEQTSQFEEHVKNLFDKLQTELASQQQSRAELEVELDRLRGEMSQNLVQSKRETANMAEALQAEQEDHITTRNELADMRKTMGEQRAKLEQLEGISQERDRHIAELEKLRSENASLARTAGTIHEKEEEIERLKAEVDGLMAATAEKDRTILRLESHSAERESLRDELAEAKARAEILEQEPPKPSASTENAELKEVLKSLKAESASAPSKEAPVDTRFSNLEQALKDAEAKLNASRGRISDVKEEMERIRSGASLDSSSATAAASATSSQATATVDPDSPLGRIAELSSSAREKLLGAGIRMYSQLAMTPPQRVLEITEHGSQEDAEKWIADAVKFARNEGA